MMLQANTTIPSTSGIKLLAYAVEQEKKRTPVRKASVWDDLNISKVSNAGLKLQCFPYFL